MNTLQPNHIVNYRSRLMGSMQGDFRPFSRLQERDERGNLRAAECMVNAFFSARIIHNLAY